MSDESASDETPLYPSGEDLSQEERTLFYSSVGQGISLWASMEGCIVELAAKLLDTTTEKTGLIFYSIANFYAWISIVDQLFELEPKYSDYRRRWTIITAALRALNDTRVRLAHHTTFDVDPDTWLALRPGRHDTRPKSLRHTPLTTMQIVKFSQSVVVVEKELREMLLEFELAASKHRIEDGFDE